MDRHDEEEACQHDDRRRRGDHRRQRHIDVPERLPRKDLITTLKTTVEG
jgi:hypothetical protein